MAAVKLIVVKSIVILLSNSYTHNWASQVAQWVKKLPTMQETPEIWVRLLGWEDALEEGMATLSSILAWRIPKDRGAWWATELDTTEATEH